MKLRPDAGAKLHGMLLGIAVSIMVLDWLHLAGLVRFGR